MKAGELRHKIAIQNLSTTRDGFGGVVETWTTIATAWARVEPLSGREFWEARKMNSDISMKITMRASGINISPRMRIALNGRHVYIEVVREIEERGIELILLCREDIA